MRRVILFIVVIFFTIVAKAQIQVPVLSEDFEGGGTIPSGWTIVDADGDGFNWTHSSVSTQSMVGHNGSSGMIFSESYDDRYANVLFPDNWLITPAVNLTGNSTLSYWVCSHDMVFYGEHYGVYISTTSPTDPSAFTLLFEETISNTSGRAQTPWVQRTINLDTYSGRTIYIAFRHFNCFDEYNVKLDDIIITTSSEVESIVVIPQEHNFGSILLGAPSESKQVEVLGSNLSQPITLTVPTPFEISVDGINWLNTEVLPATGGIFNVRYAPTMVGVDSADLMISSGSITKNVILRGSSRECNVVTLPLVESFEDINSLECWTLLSANTENDISLANTHFFDGSQSLRFSSFTYAVSTANYNQYLITPELPTNVGKILNFQYICYNTRGESFRVGYSLGSNNIDEFVWGPNISCNNNTWLEYENSSIPAGAKYVAINYNSSYDYHLFIDKFKIRAVSNCMYPSNLMVRNISGHDALVSWQPATTANGTETYFIEYAVSGSNTWQTVNTTGTNITLTGLAPFTSYDVRVYMHCGEENSDMVTTTFTTIEACSAPSNLTLSSMASTSVMVSWTPSATHNANQVFTLQYAEQENGTTQTQTQVGDHCFLMGLTPNTTYNLILFTSCGADGYSDTLTTTFTTNCITGGTSNIIGSDSYSQYQLPVNNYYKYSYTQQIFLASEINGHGTITNLDFEYNYIYAMSSKNHVDIYLKHTNKSAFYSTVDYESIEGAQLVYSGSINCHQGWNTFELTTPFEYNGVDNLMVIVDDNSNSQGGMHLVFNTHTTPANRSLCFYSDYININPAAPTAGTVNSTFTLGKRNCMRFSGPCDVTTLCVEPNVVVEDITSSEIVLAWAPGHEETTWEVQYKKTTDEIWTSAAVVTTNTYTISNLQSNSDYLVRVGVNCGSEYKWSALSVHTGCAPFTLPIVEDFESTIANAEQIPLCWARGTESIYNPAVNSSYAFSGSNSLYLEGGSNTQSTAILPEIDASIAMDSLIINFEVYSYYTKQIQIGIMTDPMDPTTFAQIGVYDIMNSNQWEHVEITTESYIGSGRHIAIRAPQGFTIYPYIDDVVVDYIPACPHVFNLTAEEVTSNDATITWEPGRNETSWQVVYGLVGHVNEENFVEVLHPTYVLTDLAANTIYEVMVRVICGDEVGAWESTTFRTGCESISMLPYIEKFDSYAVTNGSYTRPSCWGFPVTYNGYPYLVEQIMSSIPNSLKFATSSTNPTTAVTPQLMMDIHSVRVKFKLKAETMASGTFEVGVMSDSSDISTFELVESIESSNTWTEYVVEFNHTHLSGAGNYIAFRQRSNYSSYYYWLDDVQIEHIPSCSSPIGLGVESISSSSVTLTWSAEIGETGWEVYIFPTNQILNFNQIIPVSTPTYTKNNLLENTSYTAMVRTVCSHGNGYSEWSMFTFSTPSDNTAHLPYVYDFSDPTENSKWVICNNSTGNGWYFGTPAQEENSMLFVSGDNGYSATYNNSACQVWAYRDIEFPEANEYEVGIKWRCQGESNYDYMCAFVGTPNDVFASNISDITAPSNTIQLGGTNHKFNLNSDWNWFTGSTTSMNGGVKRLYFVWRNDNSTQYNPAIMIDSIMISYRECVRPQNVEVEKVTATSATLAWDEGGLSSSWKVEYGVTGFVQGTGTMVSTSTKPITITGLTSGLVYDFYVQSDCGESTSTWVGPITVTPGIYNMHTTGWDTLRVCDFDIYDDGGNFGNYSPNCDAYLVIYPETEGAYLSINGTLIAESAQYDQLKIYDGSINTTPIYSSNQSDGASVSFGPFLSSTGSLIVHFVSDGFSQFAGFHLHTTCINCLPVSNITISNITESGATVSWEGSAPNYRVFVGPAGFDPRLSSTFYNLTNQNSVDVTGLSPLTAYDVYVMSICDEDITSSYVTSSFLSSGCAEVDQCEYTFICRDTYGDGWNGGEIQVMQNGIVVETVKAVNHQGAGLASSDTIRVSLCDNTPTVFMWTAGSSDHEAAVTIIDPENSVLATFNDMSAVLSAMLLSFTTDCNFITCETPTPLDVAGISQTAATIFWQPGGSEVKWNVQYKQETATTWSNAIMTTVPYLNLQGLSANTTYHVRIQSVCSEDEVSDWTSNMVFTTLEELPETCPAPQSLLAATIENESITLLWLQQDNTADSWDVMYRILGSGNWVTVTTTTIPYTISGLHGLTTYEIKVVAHCTNGLLSESSNTISVTTTNTDVEDYLSNGVSVYPNPTEGQVVITTQSAMESISIYDVYGKIISTINVDDNYVKIDMNNYAAGVYFAKIVTAQGIVTKRIEKK